MTTEDRLIEIESKLAFQEDLLQELNQTVYRQQREIARLEAVCQELARRLRDVSDTVAEQAGGAPAQERPPHY